MHLEPLRWNPRLSKAFDVARAEFPPRSIEEALVAKYLEVDIKALERRETAVPCVRMGAFLTAVDDVLRAWSVDDVRNLNYQGEETPPGYDVIQLNSTTSSDFLIDGMRFVRQIEAQGVRATLRVEPAWYGMDVSVYGLRTLGTAQQLLTQIQQRQREINFLKGEAFSLSGEFLPKTDETFADLFLDPKNAAALSRVVTLVNTKGKTLENRGVLLMGPPGTGKTLAARIVRNDAQATFIWVSSRDFHYSGSFGGFSQAFDLARECAPSVVVFEDIDNWLYDTTVDLIKTEMDGVSRSSGVVTMMTTNYPEQLPAALIDRPGRFHDVLKFDLPTDDARTQMLGKWLPGLAPVDLARAVKATAGYSGAHVRELARFASIIAEQDTLPLDQALTAALTKLAEQRDLITNTQRTGSRYRMLPALVQKTAAAVPTIHRAYSHVTIRGFDPASRTFSGIATSPVTDRLGDTIDSKGVTFKNPLPLLLYHDSKKPVGETRFGKATAEGTPFDATISTVDRPGAVKDRLDEAVDSLSAKPPLIRGVSIGFRELDPPTYNKDTGGLNYSSIEVLELSMVVIPAHQDATIHSLKQFDIGLAASGTAPAVAPRKPSPGVSGTARVVQMRTDPNMKKSYADQIASWEATRAAKTARMDDLLTKSGDAGVTLDEAEQEEHDGLDAEVVKIDAQLVRLHAAEAREKAATQVVKGADPDEGGRSRGRTPVITVEKKLPPGYMFARHAICLAQGMLQRANPVDLAKLIYPDDSQLHASLRVKAAVGAGATTGSHWADDLVPYNILMNDFIEFLRPGSILGKFGGPNPGGGPNYPSLRKVPFNVRVTGASAGLTGHWVGEGLPAPLSKMTTFNTALTWAKVEALAVLTQEEIRFSNPSAEKVVRDDIARAVNTRLDIDFVDPALAAVANVSPASITNAVAATTPTGTTAAFFRSDLATAIAQFAANNLDPADIVLIMSAQMALELSMMVNTLGNSDFPDISMMGGKVRGFPVIVSENLTAVGSPSTQTIVAVKAGDVYLADDGVVTVDASSEASVEMLDGSLVQDGTAGTGTSLVSLWQAGLLGLKAQREITWKLRRSTAVQYLSPAAYKA